MIDEIVIIDAVDADLDAAKPLRIVALGADGLVDVIMDEALGMIRMVLLALGELGHHMQRIEMLVVPIDILLQLAGIELMGAVVIDRSMLVADAAMLLMTILQLMPVHENVFMARDDGLLAQMNDEGKLDAIDATEMGGKRVNIKIPRRPFMAIPLNVVGIGINDVSLANRFAVDLDDHLQIGGHAVEQIELDSPPANVEGVLEIVDPLKIAAEFAKHRFGVVFRYLHGFTPAMANVIMDECLGVCPRIGAVARESPFESDCLII